MARTITKKAFDDDLMLSDDFDESILDKIEKQFDQFDKKGGDPQYPSFESGTSSSSGSSSAFSLDDFEAQPAPETASDTGGASDSSSSSSRGSRKLMSDTATGGSKKTGRKIPGFKLALMATAAGVLVLATGFFVASLMHAPPKPALQIVTVIRRSIPVPIRAEKHELLILTTSGEEKVLVNMGIEINLYGMETPDGPEEEQVVLRDAIYRFLSNEHPARNTQKFWEKIVANDLQPYLKTSFPKKGMKSVRLTRFARL